MPYRSTWQPTSPLLPSSALPAPHPVASCRTKPRLPLLLSSLQSATKTKDTAEQVLQLSRQSREALVEHCHHTPGSLNAALTPAQLSEHDGVSLLPLQALMSDGHIALLLGACTGVPHKHRHLDDVIPLHHCDCDEDLDQFSGPAQPLQLSCLDIIPDKLTMQWALGALGSLDNNGRSDPAILVLELLQLLLDDFSSGGHYSLPSKFPYLSSTITC